MKDSRQIVIFTRSSAKIIILLGKCQILQKEQEPLFDYG